MVKVQEFHFSEVRRERRPTQTWVDEEETEAEQEEVDDEGLDKRKELLNKPSRSDVGDRRQAYGKTRRLIHRQDTDSFDPLRGVERGRHVLKQMCNVIRGQVRGKNLAANWLDSLRNRLLEPNQEDEEEEFMVNADESEDDDDSGPAKAYSGKPLVVLVSICEDLKSMGETELLQEVEECIEDLRDTEAALEGLRNSYSQHSDRLGVISGELQTSLELARSRLRRFEGHVESIQEKVGHLMVRKRGRFRKSVVAAHKVPYNLGHHHHHYHHHHSGNGSELVKGRGQIPGESDELAAENSGHQHELVEGRRQIPGSDDSALENSGHQPELVEGRRDNPGGSDDSAPEIATTGPSDEVAYALSDALKSSMFYLEDELLRNYRVSIEPMTQALGVEVPSFLLESRSRCLTPAEVSASEAAYGSRGGTASSLHSRSELQSRARTTSRARSSRRVSFADVIGEAGDEMHRPLAEDVVATGGSSAKAVHGVEDSMRTSAHESQGGSASSGLEVGGIRTVQDGTLTGPTRSAQERATADDAEALHHRGEGGSETQTGSQHEVQERRRQEAKQLAEDLVKQGHLVEALDVLAAATAEEGDAVGADSEQWRSALDLERLRARIAAEAGTSSDAAAGGAAGSAVGSLADAAGSVAGRDLARSGQPGTDEPVQELGGRDQLYEDSNADEIQKEIQRRITAEVSRRMQARTSAPKSEASTQGKLDDEELAALQMEVLQQYQMERQKDSPSSKSFSSSKAAASSKGFASSRGFAKAREILPGIIVYNDPHDGCLSPEAKGMLDSPTGHKAEDVALRRGSHMRRRLPTMPAKALAAQKQKLAQLGRNTSMPNLEVVARGSIRVAGDVGAAAASSFPEADAMEAILEDKLTSSGDFAPVDLTGDTGLHARHLTELGAEEDAKHAFLTPSTTAPSSKSFLKTFSGADSQFGSFELEESRSESSLANPLHAYTATDFGKNSNVQNSLKDKMAAGSWSKYHFFPGMLPKVAAPVPPTPGGWPLLKSPPKDKTRTRRIQTQTGADVYLPPLPQTPPRTAMVETMDPRTVEAVRLDRRRLAALKSHPSLAAQPRAVSFPKKPWETDSKKPSHPFGGPNLVRSGRSSRSPVHRREAPKMSQCTSLPELSNGQGFHHLSGWGKSLNTGVQRSPASKH